MSRKPVVLVMAAGLVATGAAAAIDVSHLEAATVGVQVYGITTATVAIEGSNDNVHWTAVATALTADGVAAITKPTKYIRLNVTEYTTGTIGGSCFGEQVVTD